VILRLPDELTSKKKTDIISWYKKWSMFGTLGLFGLKTTAPQTVHWSEYLRVAFNVRRHYNDRGPVNGEHVKFLNSKTFQPILSRATLNFCESKRAKWKNKHKYYDYSKYGDFRGLNTLCNNYYFIYSLNITRT